MRLCFQFHPDKNKGREELMTQAFQYLQNAFKKGAVGSDDEEAGILHTNYMIVYFNSSKLYLLVVC